MSKSKNNITNQSDEAQQNLEAQVKSIEVGTTNPNHNTKKESMGRNTKKK